MPSKAIKNIGRVSTPKIPNSFGKLGGNPWDARSTSRILASKKNDKFYSGAPTRNRTSITNSANSHFIH